MFFFGFKVSSDKQISLKVSPIKCSNFQQIGNNMESVPSHLIIYYLKNKKV